MVFIHVSVKNTGGDFNWESLGRPPMEITPVLKDKQGKVYKQHVTKGIDGHDEYRKAGQHDPYAYTLRKNEVFTYMYVYDAPIPNGEYTLTFHYSDTEFVLPLTIEWPKSF